MQKSLPSQIILLFKVDAVYITESLIPNLKGIYVGIGPNSKWKCDEGCKCGAEKGNRCRVKIKYIDTCEELPKKMLRILRKLDLSPNISQLRHPGYWRSLVKEYILENKDEL